MAAGAGKRFGGPKAPAVVGGERLVDRSVRILQESGCAPIVVVLGAWIGEVPGAIPVINSHWQEGMGSSLRTGLDYLLTTSATSALITLVDLPGLTAVGCARIVRSRAGVVAATFQGERGHPVKFNREHWAEIIEIAHGDEGARTYLRDREDVELIEIADVASGADLDYNIS